MKFMHISDLHFRERDEDNQATRKALEFVIRNYSDHRLVITGDITDNGGAEEYAWAERLLKPALGRCYLSPGNHDAGWQGNLYDSKRLKRFDKCFGTAFCGVNRPAVSRIEQLDTRVVLVGLDTNRETWWPGDFARGRVGFIQRLCLWWILRRHTEWVRMVYFHHHPFTRDPFVKMTDADKLMDILAGNCEVVMFGHEHKQEYWESYVWNGAMIPHVLAAGAMFQEDTAWEITVEGREISVQETPIF